MIAGKTDYVLDPSIFQFFAKIFISVLPEKSISEISGKNIFSLLPYHGISKKN